MAAAEYPEIPRKGDAISGVAAADSLEAVRVFHAGTAWTHAVTESDSAGADLADGALMTAGGRVLAVTATGADVADARQRAYAGVSRISFEGAQYRSDIAAAASLVST
ncbi:MAG: phosphoribosylglycinamide synthetase C domain-containing protein [Nocardioidaceae bacterium]